MTERQKEKKRGREMRETQKDTERGGERLLHT